MKKRTPAQQQYMTLKQEHEDALLFFRMGDFYEVFYDDAKIAHDVLGITLTARDKNGKNPIPMAGIPYHSLDKYTPKLLQAGYKIAIAEQVGVPKKGKIVARKVVEVLTPGTVVGFDEQANFVMSVCYTDSYVLARGDISLGVYKTKICIDQKDLLQSILYIRPSEVIIDFDLPEIEAIRERLSTHNIVVGVHETPFHEREYLEETLGVTSLDGYGQALTGAKISAIALLFSYIEQVKYQKVQPIYTISAATSEHTVLFDDITRDNLEVFTSRYEHSRKHSLYAVINKTRTPMGARLLYERLATPIYHQEILEERLGYIARYMGLPELQKAILQYLSSLSDIQRLCTRIITKTPSPTAVQKLLYILETLYTGGSAKILHEELIYIGCSEKAYTQVKEIYDLLHVSMTTEPIIGDMYFIYEGYDANIDKYRQLVFHADEILLKYQKLLQAHVGGVKVKLKRIKNQGYLLEVTPKDIERFEMYIDRSDPRYDFIRGQTLKTGQRYTTPYLRDLEVQMVSAKEQLTSKESDILDTLVSFIRERMHACIDIAYSFAEIDVSASFAEIAHTRSWCIPCLHHGKYAHISGGRHPVVEAFLPPHEEFIPNDLVINEDEYFHIITGPNMGGKSTYLRQQALILLLAHAGLPVPATSADVPLVDAIFARIGAGDALAKNQSTFMTEMLETANIIHNASDRSFILLDELGRGTSTYDGLALAKAISVYICQHIKAITLFATHYHELTGLEDTISGIMNYNVSVYENHQEVVFLKKIVRGKSSKSYGIDVAELAGIPTSIIQEAHIFLKALEQQDAKTPFPLQPGFDFRGIHDEYRQTYDAIQAICAKHSIDEITPIEALIILQEIKKQFERQS